MTLNTSEEMQRKIFGGNDMKADEEKIKRLLANKTQLYVAEQTGIAQSKISRIKNGNIKMKNITFEVASKLTELAEEINV